MRRRFRAPIRRSGDGFVIDLGPEEAALVRRMIDELRQLLSDPEPGAEAGALLMRLFPVAYPDDDDAEAEYQRLMREELVASKLATFEIDEGGLIAFMQSVNSLRLALGTMIGVTDEPDAEVDPDQEDTPEYHLYGYLSWLLEWSVRAIQS